MEELLDHLIKEAQSTKYGSIKESCQRAKDLLESQSSLLQCSPSELRATCFKALQEALESKHSKMLSLAISGFQKLLRDNQFYNGFEEHDESTWLPCQLMTAFNNLPLYSEDVQVELLKVILSMSCVPNITMSGHIVVQIIGVCGVAYGRGSPAMQSAGQSAAIQAIVALLNQIVNESVEQESAVNKIKNESDSQYEHGVDDFVAPAFDELVPVINFIADKLVEANKLKECKKDVEIPALFLLECANSLLNGLPSSEKSVKRFSYCIYHSKEKCDCSSPAPPAYCSTLLVSSLWQRLSPALIALLGTPVSMGVCRGIGRTQGTIGRGSGTSSVPMQLFSSQEAKVIYSVACNLIVAMGTVGEMRPVLESLFHRMLLYPPPNCRHDALRIVSELLRTPSKLIQFAGPILHSDPRNRYQCDLTLFRLIMDSLMECSNCKESWMKMMIVDNIAGLLYSLEKICEGKILSPLQVKVINESYAKLEDVDYLGPLTYNNLAKLPTLEPAKTGSSDEDSSIPDSFSQNSDENDENIKKKEIHNLPNEEDEQREESVKDERLEVIEDDAQSTSSGGTEGPEELEVCEIEQQQLEEEEDLRLLRLSKSLGSDAIRSILEEEQERECINARHFCVTLQSLLLSLLTIRSTIEVDEAVLEFSSKYCQGAFSETGVNTDCHIIINADGIYLATYASLSLNLKLIQSGYYCNSDIPLIMTQDQFIENVFASGVLVYLSSSWVGELFCQVVKDSFLQRAGYNPHSPYNCALVNLLTDLDGLGNVEQGSQMLSDYRRLSKAAVNVTRSETEEAGRKLCRRILTCCWESILSILGTLLKYLEEESGIVAPIRLLLLGDAVRKDETKKGQDVLILCLNTLQSTARLANLLGLQKRCGVVFSLLSSACLPGDDRNPLSTPKRKAFHTSSITRKPLRLHRSHVLSFHVLMSLGLELGSHSLDCWSHLFKCCSYLSELERKFFSSLESVPSYGRSLISNQATRKGEGLPTNSSDDIFFDEKIYNVPPTLPVPPDICIEELMMECEEEISSSGFLSSQLSGKALCSLTLLIDKFFDSAATQLNLAALVSFLSELCEASQAQLFARINSCTPRRSFLSWPRKVMSGINYQNKAQGLVEDILLLHRVGEIMLKVVRSGRPLIHIMRAWSVAGPHFLEAACHKDGAVSKKAVSCIHDIVNALLGCQVELPHFHFNEALFKPFENLLCLELCDIEVQDQIVSSICEFVESCCSEIRSGWRPLFGALRCIRGAHLVPQAGELSLQRDAQHEAVRHLRAAKDVFEAFLGTDNIFVFANAALDCILCLLKHVKGPSEGEQVAETVVCWGELVGGDLCLDALRYIHRCSVILASMYSMPTSPVFHVAHRVTLTSSSHLVDPNLPGIEECYLWALINEIVGMNRPTIDYSCLWPQTNDKALLIDVSQGSGLLQVWYTLLEGLSGSIVTCPRRYQAQVLDSLFIIMRSLPDCPGPQFAMHCVNHLLLPLMQDWLRRSNQVQGPTWESAQCFKQYVGLTADLIVEYIERAAKEDTLNTDKHCHVMLQQMLLVLTECITCPSEVIARLGCSCIRHIAISCGDKLPPKMWEILVTSLHRVSQVSLFPLYQLMRIFYPDSPNFYGDDGHVKVAARRDCTGRDSDRLRQLSHQVFLLDAQRNPFTCMEDNADMEDRSFIFLLYPDSKWNSETYEDKAMDSPFRVPFRGLVVGLVASQMILQTLGQVLVEGSPHVVPSLANVLLQASDFSHQNGKKGKCIKEIKGELPGLLKWLKTDQIMTLLDSLRLTYEAAVQFDRRPGLKFLIQKVAQSDRAAHLYKQAGASWMLRMLTLFDLTLSKVKHGLNLDQVKEIINEEIKQKKTVKHEKDRDLSPLENATLQRPSKLFNDDTQIYISMLCQAFNVLCDSYLELVTKNASQESLVDAVNDQPIFFLTIPADEFSTSHRKNLDSWTKNLEEFNKDYIKDKRGAIEEGKKLSRGEGEVKAAPKVEEENTDISGSSSLPVTMTLGISEATEEQPMTDSPASEKKPFCFADLAQPYDSEEDDNFSTCTKGGDSGVDSAAGIDQSIYSIATEKDITVMVGDYRRRKNHHSLPSQHNERRINPFLDSPTQHLYHPTDPVPPEIEEQRSSSLMKDSEAHLKVWTEMVVNVFDLISQLSDSELRPLLPLVFPTMRSLTAHAHDPHLRQVVAEMLNRVACLYGFSPAE